MPAWSLVWLQTRTVLVYVYDKILKLSHPFMPFITEEMWQVGCSVEGGGRMRHRRAAEGGGPPAAHAAYPTAHSPPRVHPPFHTRQASPHTGAALIAAPWPAADAPVDDAAATQFEALQAAVRAVRNARAEYGVEVGRKIAATVRCAPHAALRDALVGVMGSLLLSCCCPAAVLVLPC